MPEPITPPAAGNTTPTAVTTATTEVTPPATTAPVTPPVTPTEPTATVPPVTEVPKPTETKTPEVVKVVPEKYDIKAPEGSALDQAALDKIAAVAKTRGLSNEEAQAEVERESSFFMDTAKELHAKQVEKWTQESQSDREIGGENFVRSVEHAQKALKHFGDEKFNKMLVESGYGSNPEVIRTFAKIGAEMSNAKLIMPGAQPGGTKTYAESLYGKK